MSDHPEKFEQHCIVEVMGHRRFAGLVTEQVIGGASFVRVDVPAVDGRAAFCKLIGAGSIYMITPVSEEVAQAAANALRSEAMPVYCPSIQPALPFGGEDDYE